ncbi:MAG: Dabb family protein, partial [Bacteroidales bacterium]|nr:Dabb family protein [Bacteroidales bacterium]
MIKHIVMFKLSNKYTPEERKRTATELKALLDELPQKISEIKAYEVGVNISKSANAYDLVLVSLFESMETLEAYRVHEAHQAVVAKIKEHKKETKAKKKEKSEADRNR